MSCSFGKPAMAFEYLVWHFSVPGPIRGSSMQITGSVGSLGQDVYGGLRIKASSSDGEGTVENFVVVFSATVV
jgi:hypothetical protein